MSVVDPDDPIVVIGAGIVGCSAAYHLLRSGAHSVTLLDAMEPGAATTPAGAGFVALWAAGSMPLGSSGLGLERYSLEFYRELHTAGAAIGYRSNGNLLLALTPEGWNGRPARVFSDPSASVGTRTLGPDEIASLAGTNPEAVHAAVLMPSGIQVETGSALSAVLGMVVGLGGSIRPGAHVDGFDTSGGEVRGVHTTSGRLDAAAVVIAAGAWTNDVLRHLDWRLPLLRVVITRVETEDVGVAPTMPTVQCPEAGLWIRGKKGGYTWGTFPGYEPVYRFEDRNAVCLPGRPRSGRLLEKVLDSQARIGEIFPRLASAKAVSWMQGIAVYTPDRSLIVGLVPGYDNVVVVGGDNESGVSHGPAMGKLGAELARGLPPFVDPAPFRVDRFDMAEYPDEASVEARLRAIDAPVFGAG